MTFENEFGVERVGRTSFCPLSTQVIGETGVFVPTHLYKVILAEKGDGGEASRHFMAAFVVPNKHISKDKKLKDFWYTMDHYSLHT